jgi:splicing factor 3B subunit 1
MASEKRNYKQLIETTVEIATRVGVIEIVEKLYLGLKDENESYRKMVMEGITKILETEHGTEIGYAEENFRNELIDCVLAAFHEQTTDDSTILDGFGAVVNALGLRAKPYFVQIVGTIHWRLNHKNIRIRQQAADLVSKIAKSMRICG